MGLERTDKIHRHSAEIVQELLKNVNALWRELTLKSKPRKEFVDEQLSKLGRILNELRERFLKGSDHVR